MKGRHYQKIEIELSKNSFVFAFLVKSRIEENWCRSDCDFGGFAMAENTMGNRIKDLRKRRGLTQEALAQLMYIPKSTISAYENDVIDIKSSVIIELAKVLNTRPRYFLEEEEMEDTDLEELVLVYRKITEEKLRKVALEQVKILMIAEYL